VPSILFEVKDIFVPTCGYAVGDCSLLLVNELQVASTSTLNEVHAVKVNTAVGVAIFAAKVIVSKIVHASFLI